jgi:hypothetical protein
MEEKGATKKIGSPNGIKREKDEEKNTEKKGERIVG